MLYIISVISSVLILCTLLRFSYDEECRRTYDQSWDECKWEIIERHKFPVWVYLILTVVSFLPILNTTVSVISIIIYIVQYNDCEQSIYIKERLVLKCKLIYYFRWLNKKI